jgi:hypothetical protein
MSSHTLETKTTNKKKNKLYFLDLVDYSKRILDALPIEPTPQPLDYALGKLKSVLYEIKHDVVEGLKKLNRPDMAVKAVVPKLGVGMNSIGLLADRLTILIIKEWCLRNKLNSDTTKADNLYSSQTLDIIEAMADARPRESAINAKITTLKANTDATCWEEAYYGLFMTNLLMWESQEVLYIKDITQLPYEELRDYVKWFSFSNIMRNEYVEHCEKLYWNKR